MIIISWIALLFSIAGYIFINYKNIFGYYIWIISNILWIIYNIYINELSQIILFNIYTLLSIHGVYKWKIKGEK